MLLSINLCDSKKGNVIYSCNEEFVETLTLFLMSCDTYNGCIETNAHNVELHGKHDSTDDKQNSMGKFIQQKRLLYSHSVARDEEIRDNYWNTRIHENRIISIHRECRAQLSTYTYKDVIFLKEWPGRSPTINTSWFIAKAYLANLYYTT